MTNTATGPSPKALRDLQQAGFERVYGAEDREAEARAVEFILSVARRRLAENPNAVIHGKGADSVYLSGNDQAIRVLVSNSEEKVIISYVRGNGRWLKVIGGQLWYHNSDSFPYHHSELTMMADTMSIAPRPQVPYLVLREDRRQVVAVIFAWLNQEGGGRLIYGADFYVLKGHERPEVCSDQEEPGVWDSFWQAFRDGLVVEGGARLARQPEPVAFEWDTKMASLVFFGTDGKEPVLAPGGLPYLQWWPREESPGSDGREYGGTPLINDLRTWFKARS